MKKAVLMVFVLAAVGNVHAQKALVADAQLKQATVYYGTGAELQHTAAFQLVAGSQEIAISNLSQSIDVNSIQLACPENVTILNYRFGLSEKPEPALSDLLLKRMEDSILLIKKQLLMLDNDYGIETEVLAKTGLLIESYTATQQSNSNNTAEMVKLLDYYNQKIRDIKTGLFRLTEKKTILSDSINHISWRIGERRAQLVSPAGKQVGQLLVQVLATNAGKADFSLSYFTKDAGWLPAYDFRVQSADNSCKLVYKASVHQSTGLDWKQVKLSLTTTNPNQGNALPILNPWFVALYVPQVAHSLQEVVVVGYGRAPGIAIDDEDKEYKNRDKEPKRKQIESSLVQSYTTLTESQLNVSFDIDLPYDIASGSNPVSVAIKNEPVKAGFKHYVIPKVDREAFLMAEISDWESLNLMPGEANIIMDNVYLGKSFIDPNTTADTLTVSLGRDKRIAVTRTLVKDFTRNKIKGDNKTETYTYEIVVKNNKITAADIIIRDQVPVSKQNEIEVAITENADGELDKETGLLTWKMKPAAGETKKFRYGYTVKYPADKKLAAL